MDRRPIKRGKMWATILSLPSLIAVALVFVVKIAELLGNYSLGYNVVTGALVAATYVLSPVASVVLIGWAIARWINKDTVPTWMLLAAIGNGIVFFVLYQMTLRFAL